MRFVAVVGLILCAPTFAQEAEVDRVVERDEVALTERQMNNIRGTISTATEAALTEGQLRSLAQRLTSADEARLAQGPRNRGADRHPG